MPLLSLTQKNSIQTMISICIPIYNFDVTKLVLSLEVEINRKQLEVNIVLIDDNSNQKFKKLNRPICSKHQYIQLEKNIGRAKIRNLFLQYTSSEYLLFLDCDSLIVSENFITNYSNTVKEKNSQVICGGRIYETQKPPRNKRLSWKYGIKIESKSYKERQQNPNKSFMTNNFLIKREILEQIKFDERLSKYGHEDTLFGYQLKKQKLPITHINNSILNGDIEDNKTFLKKTTLGIENLVKISEYINYDNTFVEDVTLLSFHNKLEQKKLNYILSFFFPMVKPILKFTLEKGLANLTVFNFYKLGIYNKYKIKPKHFS